MPEEKEPKFPTATAVVNHLKENGFDLRSSEAAAEFEKLRLESGNGARMPLKPDPQVRSLTELNEAIRKMLDEPIVASELGYSLWRRYSVGLPLQVPVKQ